MTDQAIKGISATPSATTATVLRARPVSSLGLGDKVVSLSLPSIDEFVAEAEKASPAAARDYGSALELVREASEAIRVGEERANQLEEHLAEVLKEATSEIQRLNELVAEGDRKLAQMQAKADAAEARAIEAETWLAKLHDAVVTSFTAVLNKSEGAPAAQDQQRPAMHG